MHGSRVESCKTNGIEHHEGRREELSRAEVDLKRGDGMEDVQCAKFSCFMLLPCATIRPIPRAQGIKVPSRF